MWLGFAVAGTLALLNGLNFIFPVVPELRTRIRSFHLFTDSPWNAMGRIPLSFYPFCYRARIFSFRLIYLSRVGFSSGFGD